MKTERIHCFECGVELEDHDTIYNIGGEEYICEDCRDTYYICCEDCNELVRDDDIIAVDVDYNCRYVCEECARRYFMCDHCGELYSSDHIAVDVHYITLCIRCYGDHYFTCPGCDEVYHIDDGEFVGSWYYCRSCADEHRTCIQPYSYKPTPVFFGGGRAGYGIELEIDGGYDVQDAAEHISKVAEDLIYIKEDGSLSGAGMEIVTHPATLDYHVNHFPWSEICEAALSHGYRSHDTDTCGLHIHASRSLFGSTEIEQDLTIAKIILLIDRWYDSYIVRFARRDLARMRRWADKPNAGIRPEDNDSAAVDKSKKTATDRYKAVNLCNSHTVEFRFFKGTLRRNTIIASIQWIDTIIKYCRNAQLKDLFSTTWDDVFASTGHAELTEYLKQRNLIKEEI